jgi:hypothetical protein
MVARAFIILTDLFKEQIEVGVIFLLLLFSISLVSAFLWGAGGSPGFCLFEVLGLELRAYTLSHYTS